MSVEDLISPVANQTSWTEKAYQNIYKMRSKALMNMFVRQSTQHKHQHVATIGGISFLMMLLLFRQMLLGSLFIKALLLLFGYLKILILLQ